MQVGDKVKVGDWLISSSHKSRAFQITDQRNINYNYICAFKVDELRFATKQEIEASQAGFTSNIIENFQIY